MPIYHTLGQIPRKRHIAFRKPDGGLYAEELMGHEGFTGTSSLLYHAHPPTTVKSARRLRETKYEADPDQTLRHRHFRTSQVKKGGSPTLDRIPLLFNQDIAMLYVEPDENDAHFYRNAQADELVYVGKGSGTLESVFGDLPYRRGRLSRHPPRHHAPVAARSRRRADQAAGHGEPRARALAQALSQRVRPAHRRRALQRARHPPAERAADPRRAGRLPHPGEAVRRAQRDHPRPPSVRRGRLGRLLLSRGRSTSTTSSRSSAGCTSRRRCTRPSRATASWSAASARGRTTSIRRRCRRRTTTATSIPTRCSTTPRASS